MADGSMAPSGTYRFSIKMLRVYGDVAVDADWDEVLTDSFTVKYGGVIRCMRVGS